MIRIAHTAEDGTVVHGDCRPHHPILKDAGFRWSRHQGFWYLPNSRDRQPRTAVIDRAAGQLRAVGFDVEVDVDASLRSTAEREADRRERIADRQDGLDAKAERLAETAETLSRRADDMASIIPFGQPILVGHHSERRDRNYRDRIHNTMVRGIETDREATETGRRAEASRASEAHKESLPTTLRRIDRFEAELRDVERKQAGKPCLTTWMLLKEEFADRSEYHCGFCGNDVAVVERVIDVHYRDGDRPAFGAWGERLHARHEQLTDEIAYWKAHVATLEAQGQKVWSKADFAKGDMVKTRFGWRQVVRVNAKSVSVKTNYSWTDTVPYNEVLGQRRPTDETGDTA